MSVPFVFWDDETEYPWETVNQFCIDRDTVEDINLFLNVFLD